VSRIKLKYVHQFVDKRRGAAKARFYFRRRGFPQLPLPRLPGSPEFNAAYERALAGSTVTPPIGAKRVRVGSIGALALAWFNSPEFLTLKPATQRTYRLIVEKWLQQHRDKLFASLERKHVKAMLAEKAKKPAAANHWLRLLKSMMHFAIAEGMRSDDPTAGVDFIERKATGFHTWNEDEIAQFEARHPIGSKARLALALLLYTAQRRSDVVKMGRQHVRNGVAQVHQQKTGAMLAIPVHPDLQTILDATPRAREHLTFLVTEYGKPFTAAGFGGWFRERCNEAGLPKRCASHGLRKAACRRLAEAGCSANVIASISGHVTLREVERYTKAADQARMARIGIAALAARTEANGKVATVESEVATEKLSA
jgi:integrase